MKKKFRINGKLIRSEITEEDDIDLQEYTKLYGFAGQIMPALLGGFPATISHRGKHIDTINLRSEGTYEFRNPMSGYQEEVTGNYAMLMFGLYLMTHNGAKNEDDQHSFDHFYSMVREANHDLYMNFLD